MARPECHGTNVIPSGLIIIIIIIVVVVVVVNYAEAAQHTKKT